MAAIELLQELIRLDTTNPPGQEGPAAELLEARLASAGLEGEILMSPGGRPSLVARLPGPQDRSALVLLSHTDVVGVEEDKWSHDPFGGAIDDGFIWGRGAIDMKSIAVMHAEAVMALAASGETIEREIIFVSVADEEAGGLEGAEWLVPAHPEKVGLRAGGPAPEILGEGAFGITGVLDVPVIPVALGEKSALWISLRARGEPGHGSIPPARTALHNLTRFVNEVARDGAARVHPVMREQFGILAAKTTGSRRRAFQALASSAGPAVARVLRPRLDSRVLAATLADTVTPTMLSAGYKTNVVPGEATGSLDVRLLPDTDPGKFVADLRRRGVKHDVHVEVGNQCISPVSDKTALYDIITELSKQIAPGAVVVPSITPGTTDVRVFRRAGAGGYGWAPLVLTPEVFATIHGHDERVEVAGFERAVELVTQAVRRAAVGEHSPLRS
ncbi:MAG: M20/M25/M40 family metallo-hydrolase [Actinomycetota bacterium]